MKVYMYNQKKFIPAASCGGRRAQTGEAVDNVNFDGQFSMVNAAVKDCIR